MKLYAWRLMRITGQAVLGLTLAIGAYATAGLIGGAIPVHANWRPPARGIPIWIESNGVHVGLILPKTAAGMDLSAFAPAADLRDPRYAAYDHVAIGWGEKDFYLGTPHWADVRLRTIMAAAIGSEATLLHVEHVPGPIDGAQRIMLRTDEYRRLATFVQATFKRDGRIFQGYDNNDVFYPARGRYSALRTCNSWVGDALRHAGVRIGRWTPFPVTVTGWFPPTTA